MSDHITSNSWNEEWNKDMRKILLENQQQNFFSDQPFVLDSKPGTSTYIYSTLAPPITNCHHGIIQRQQGHELETVGVDLKPNEPGNYHQEQDVQINRHKIQITSNLINLLFLHKDALEKNHSLLNLKPLLRGVLEFITSHNCQKLMRENDGFSSGSESESLQENFVLFIDGIPITRKMWAKAEGQIKLTKIANSLFEDMFTPEEIFTDTMKSRKLKSGVTSKALDPIRINVIYKVTAWMMKNRSLGNSFELYNANDPTNPFLLPEEISIVRDALGQKRNNYNQVKKGNNSSKIRRVPQQI